MRHLFIVDPLPGLSVTQDTSVVFLREAARRGHTLATCAVQDVELTNGRPFALASPTVVEPWFELGPQERTPLDAFDVVWMRTDPPYDLNYFFAAHVLSLAGPDTLVVNSGAGLREVTEKLFVLRYPDLTPPTRVSRRIDDLLAFRDDLGGDMILKPLDGCGGLGVFHLRAGDPNTQSILETATQSETRYQIAQAYLPEIRDGDKRIILLEGEPIGAVLRVPREGESRANFHVGGTAQKTEITKRDREICDRLRPALVEHGILFAGIDVIGPWLTEVNVTSPTGIQEINALDSTRLEEQVLDRVEERASAQK